MSRPRQVHYVARRTFLSDAEFEAFQGQPQGFLETNSTGEFGGTSPTSTSPDIPYRLLLDLYAAMYFRWDGIGVTNRFDHWWVRYVSPFAEEKPMTSPWLKSRPSTARSSRSGGPAITATSGAPSASVAGATI